MEFAFFENDTKHFCHLLPFKIANQYWTLLTCIVWTKKKALIYKIYFVFYKRKSFMFFFFCNQSFWMWGNLNKIDGFKFCFNYSHWMHHCKTTLDPIDFHCMVPLPKKPYAFIASDEHKRIHKCFNCFSSYNKSKLGTRQSWTSLTFLDKNIRRHFLCSAGKKM